MYQYKRLEDALGGLAVTLASATLTVTLAALALAYGRSRQYARINRAR